jgi:hypothetical protein
MAEEFAALRFEVWNEAGDPGPAPERRGASGEHQQPKPQERFRWRLTDDDRVRVVSTQTYGSAEQCEVAVDRFRERVRELEVRHVYL